MSNGAKGIAAVVVLGLLGFALWSVLGSSRAGEAVEPSSVAGVEDEAGADAEASLPARVDAEPADSSLRAQVEPEVALAEASETWLVVRVVGEGTGEPLAGFEVSAWVMDEAASGARDAVEAETDAEGLVELAVEPGVRLDVFARDTRLSREPPVAPGDMEVDALRAGERREVTLELRVGRDLVFFGRVVDETTGAPIAGARATNGFTDYAQVSDADGWLRLDVPSGQPSSFALRAEGYGQRRFVPAAGSERTESARKLPLLPVASLKVTVRDEGPAPLDSLSVRLSAKSYEMDMPDQQLQLGGMRISGGGPTSWSADCAADGTCELRELPAHVPFEVELLRAGKVVLRPGGFGLEPGEQREVEWSLNAGARVVGEVMDQHGERVPRLALGRFPASMVGRHEDTSWFVPEHAYKQAAASTASDEDGRFIFEDVPPGTWWFGPRPPEGDPLEVAALAVRVDVPAGVAEVPLVLQVERGVFISGQVEAPDGEVPKHAWVSTSSEDAAGGLFGQMEPDGSFRVGPLGAGPYRLVAQSFGDHANSRPVFARAGEEDVVLRLEPGGKLIGIVVDANDGKGCKAALSLSGREAHRKQSSGTAADGSFELNGLSENTYDLCATTADGRVGILRGVVLAPGATSNGLRIELRRGARVEVRYNGSTAHCQYDVLSDGAAVGFDGLKTGGAAAVFVPPGPVEVVFSLAGQEVERQQGEARDGEELVFVFEPDEGE